MNKTLIQEIKKEFKSRFQTEPMLSFAPGRINIIGEHTDYNEGLVFPAAIDLGIGVALEKSTDESCIVFSKDREESFQFQIDESLSPIPYGDWRNYIIGMLLELKKKGVSLGGFHMVFGGDIPIGSGLSSSAAFENAFLVGLNSLFQLNLEKLEMVLMAQQAEHNAVGVKCGIMDQYSSMFGEKGSALLLDCQSTRSQCVPIDFKEYEILLINSNVSHSLADSAYNDRRASCERVSSHFGVASLRALSLEKLETEKDAIDTNDYTKARYILLENHRVKKTVEALKQGNIQTLGELLFEAHKGMRDEYEISCKEIDFLVEEARKSSEVKGARMMGGGFGGCTLNIIKKGCSSSFFEEVSERYQKKWGHSCSAISVRIGDGARMVSL